MTRTPPSSIEPTKRPSRAPSPWPGSPCTKGRNCSKEFFGPIVVLHRYSRLEEAIEAVNAGQYGLQAGICTRDIGRALEAARKLHVGGVMVNDVPAFRVDLMPYGGAKMSGVGREGLRYAVEEMTELNLICWRG